MTRLIGISGKKQSGKDTFCTIFNKYHPDFLNKKFADKLKEICSCITGLPLKYFYDHKQYENVIPGWNLTIRQFQQRLGTEAIRQGLDNNSWVYSLFSTFKPNSKWIVTDVRFPNEANEIKKQGGILIRVNRGTGTDNHESETALDDYLGWDYVIDNNSTIYEYEKNIVELIEKLNI